MKMIRNTYHRLLSIFSLLFLMALVSAVMITGCSPSAYPSHTYGSPDAGMRVHFMDVGQGDCGLIEADGHYMLIDAGEADYKDQVIRYLENQGITTLDYVIGTHPHSDHIGGLADVIEAFDIGTVILPPKEHTTRTFERTLDAISQKGLKITKPVVGTKYQLGDASFTIIAPNADYGDDLNNWSVGIRLDYGYTSFVFTGDAETAAESDICGNGISLNAHVLKLGHHGSSTSNSKLLLEKVDPDYAVISCGEGNSYGHPHKEVMAELEQMGIQVFRTDQEGTVIASSDGNDIFWETETGQTKEKPQEEPIPEKLQLETVTEYILNTNTKKIHKPDCSSVRQIKTDNRKTYSGDLESIKEQGYSACKICNP